MLLNTTQIGTFVTQIEEIGQFPVEWYGTQKLEDVSRCEELLQKKLPPTLRQFVTEYGGGGIQGSEISGVVPEQSFDLGGTLLGDSARIQDEFDLPLEFLVIYSSDDETVWCIDYTVKPDEQGELPVVVIDLVGYFEGDDQWQPRRTHGTFGDFLLEHLRHYTTTFDF